MKKALFIVNPHAGKMIIRENLVDILSKFNADGYDTTVYITQCANDATEYIKSITVDYDLIISCGGDGTLNEVLRGITAIDRDYPPITCIPAGTVNDFAHSLGIPSEIKDAADIILNSKPHYYDFGLFNNEIYSYVAAAGAFTEVSYATPQYLKNLFGKYAYFFEASRKLIDLSHMFNLHIEIDNEQIIDGDFVYVSVSNSKSIGGVLQFDEDKDMLTDGKFELLLIKTPQNPLELQKMMNAMKTKIYDNDCVRCIHGSEFKITSDTPLPWVLDGEYAGAFETAHITMNKKRIQMVYPD